MELFWLIFRTIAPDFSLKAVASEGKTRPNADARIRSLKTGGRKKKNLNQENAGTERFKRNLFRSLSNPDNALELRYESLTCNKSVPFIRNS
jgi:hypothetical protein